MQFSIKYFQLINLVMQESQNNIDFNVNVNVISASCLSLKPWPNSREDQV